MALSQHIDFARLSSVELRAWNLVCAAGIRPVIVGGVALKIWGAKRTTRDLDLLGDWSWKQLTRLRDSIKLRRGHWGPSLCHTEIGRTRENWFRMEGLKVDLLCSWDWRSQEVIRRARVRKAPNDVTLLVARLEDVMSLKMSLGRPKDIRDVKRGLTKFPLIDDGWLKTSGD
jgi:hypothetical protein